MSCRLRFYFHTCAANFNKHLSVIFSEFLIVRKYLEWKNGTYHLVLNEKIHIILLRMW
jgi:hypothetical protein